MKQFIIIICFIGVVFPSNIAIAQTIKYLNKQTQGSLSRKDMKATLNKEKRARNSLDKALRSKIKEHESIQKKQTPVNPYAEHLNAAAAATTQKAYYNHHEGYKQMQENAAIDLENERVKAKPGESSKPIKHEKTKTAFNNISNPAANMIAILEGKASPIPSGGHYIEEFHRKMDAIAIDFKKDASGSYSNGYIRIIPLPENRNIKEVFQMPHSNVSDKEKSISIKNTDSPYASSLGQDEHNSDFKDPIHIFCQPNKMAIVTENPPPLPSSSNPETVPEMSQHDVDSIYTITRQLLQKKLNTYQLYSDLVDIKESYFQSFATAALEDGTQAIAEFVDPYPGHFKGPQNITRAKEVVNEITQESILNQTIKTGFNNLRTKYNIEKIEIPNTTADIIGKIRDVVSLGEKSAQLTGVTLPVTKNPLYKVVKASPEIGTGLGNAASAITVYFSKRKALAERDALGHQIQQLDVRLTKLVQLQQKLQKAKTAHAFQE